MEKSGRRGCREQPECNCTDRKWRILKVPINRHSNEEEECCRRKRNQAFKR